MGNRILLVLGILGLSAGLASAEDGRPGLSGTWKLDPAKSEVFRTAGDLTLLIEETGQDLHIKETRGPNPKADVSEFTCGTMGKDCGMQDGANKARVSLYYNGPVLVIMKTHGRKGAEVEKRRLSLDTATNSLRMEIIHIEPEGKAEKLLFSKVQ